MSTKDNIILHKTFNFNPNKLFLSIGHPVLKKILYFTKYNKEPLIIQSPLLYIPFNIQDTKNHKNIHFSFHNISYSKQTKHFYDTIVNIHNSILSKIKTLNKTVYGIKETIGFPPILRINIDNTSIWNQNKQKISIEKLKKNTFGTFILHLEGIYTNSKNVGFIWVAKQIRLKEEIVFNEYAFVDDNITPTILNMPVPPPLSLSNDKYSKMLKMGVSKEAVEQKKVLDGIKKPSIQDLQLGLNNLKKVKKIKKKKQFNKPDTNQFIIDKNTIYNALKNLKSI